MMLVLRNKPGDHDNDKDYATGNVSNIILMAMVITMRRTGRCIVSIKAALYRPAHKLQAPNFQHRLFFNALQGVHGAWASSISDMWAWLKSESTESSLASGHLPR